MEKNADVENVILEERVAKSDVATANSDVAKLEERAVKSDVAKRERKLTAKGVSFLIENLQKNRKLTLNQASKIKLQIDDLLSVKITTDSLSNVENLIKEFNKL